jgi:uncharacterized membrane protein YhaH (DUF805 family)
MMNSEKERYDKMLKDLNAEQRGRRLFEPRKRRNYFWWWVGGVTVLLMVGMVVFIENAIEFDNYFNHEPLGFKRRVWFQVVVTVVVLSPLAFRFVRNKLFR